MVDKYCFQICSKGKEYAQKLLATEDSVFDAVGDFEAFVLECKDCDRSKIPMENKTVDNTIQNLRGF